MEQQKRSRARVPLVDVARGAALLAMAIYHFAWDLEFFGYAPAGMTAETGWKLFARSIASSFLFLVGFSLVLAHAEGVRWRPFRKRWLMVAGSAAGITLLTWLALGEGFIFFGILHHIALASVVGLLFLRVPLAIVLLAAAAALAAPHWLRDPFFDAPPLWWVGLSTGLPRSNDYVPLVPWFGAVLLGIAAARIAAAGRFLAWLAGIGAPRWTRPASFAGRHSLAFYLLHQPILIGALWLFSFAMPPDPGAPQDRFFAACRASCLPVRDEAFCGVYCGCALEKVEAANRLDEALSGSHNAETRSWMGEIASQCTWEVEAAAGEGAQP